MKKNTLNRIQWLIHNSETPLFDDAIKYERDPEMFYYLSEMRKALINWYDFGKDSKVLEIGAEIGTLTSVLCSKCKSVTAFEEDNTFAGILKERYKDNLNLEVVSSDFWNTTVGEKYDYIVLIGYLDGKNKAQRNDILNKLSSLLSENGKILIGMEMERAGDFSEREELVDLLKSCGLKKYRFYYPFPDYRYTLQIYSDERYSVDDIGERINSYKETENIDLLPKSILLECSKKGDLSTSTYIANTTDRGAGLATATIIEKDFVRKKALYDEGIASIENDYNNIQYLKSRGIGVVDHILKNGEIIMPFISAPTLMDYIRTIAGNRDKIIEVFEKLWEEILLSSEQVDNNENSMMSDVDNSLDWGPILKKALIEMIPLNAFYVSDSIKYFDQEFAKDCFPAKYVMFRAILYTYINAPEIENVISQREMKKMYGIDETLWECFLRYENEFVSEVKRYKINSFLFYKEINELLPKNLSLFDIKSNILSKGIHIENADYTFYVDNINGNPFSDICWIKENEPNSFNGWIGIENIEGIEAYLGIGEQYFKLEWIEREDSKTTDGRYDYWGVSCNFVPVKSKGNKSKLSILLVSNDGTNEIIDLKCDALIEGTHIEEMSYSYYIDNINGKPCSELCILNYGEPNSFNGWIGVENIEGIEAYLGIGGQYFKLEWIEHEDAKMPDGKVLFWGVSGAFVPIKGKKTDSELSLLLVNRDGTCAEKKLGIMEKSEKTGDKL